MASYWGMGRLHKFSKYNICEISEICVPKYDLQ
jgi:hypothetical protein